jgi:hypothetical protein
MHDRSEIGEEVGDPKIAELWLPKGGDAGAEKLFAHRKMKSRGARMNSILAWK